MADFLMAAAADISHTAAFIIHYNFTGLGSSSPLYAQGMTTFSPGAYRTRYSLAAYKPLISHYLEAFRHYLHYHCRLISYMHCRALGSRQALRLPPHDRNILFTARRRSHILYQPRWQHTLILIAHRSFSTRDDTPRRDEVMHYGRQHRGTPSYQYGRHL